MTDDNKPAPLKERRSAERVPDDADWETKVMARVRGRLRRAAADTDVGSSDAAVDTQSDAPAAEASNWEEQVAAKIRERANTDRS